MFVARAKQTQERHWLAEVSNIPLQQSIRDLKQAYANFFKSLKKDRKEEHFNPPQFKKRRAAQSARFTRYGFKIERHATYLAKIGYLKTVWSRPLPSEPSSATAIKDPAGRYFLSFVVEVTPERVPASRERIGIDLGVINFATLDTGEKIDAPKPLKNNLKRLRKRNKALSRKKEGSNRWKRTKRKLAKLYARIADTRQDFLHKLSTRLVSENQAIAIEDLNVSGMLKNRKLARAISDLGWRQFRDLLAAKCRKYGRDFQLVNRWEPTSQRCSHCRQRGGKKHLDIRQWECLSCGAFLDRDINAAINIKVAGGQSETQNGRGGGHKTSVKEAAAQEASTQPEPVQLLLFG